MKRLLIPAVVVFLYSLSPVIAVSCASFNGDDYELCTEINALNLTEQDKQMLVTMAFYTDREIPNHDFISVWNQQISFVNPPDGVIDQNQGTIKNAWLKTIGVMPSVLENGTLYRNNEGTLQTAYHYDYQLPSGVLSGDCNTFYYFNADKSNFTALANNQLIGNSKLSQFNLQDSEVTFSSKLHIILETQIQHWKNHQYCCKYNNGVCTKWCWKCEFDNTQIQTDQLTLTDSLNATIYNKALSSDFSIVNEYENTTKGLLAMSNASRVFLNYGNSDYSKTDYVYDFVYSLAPYNVLTLRALPLNSNHIDNLIIETLSNGSFYFTAPTSNNCFISIGNHFKLQDQACNLDFNKVAIKIKTDKFYYKINETIIAEIEPSDLPVIISYGTENKTAIGTTTFLATYPENKLSAKYGQERFDAFVSVNKPDNFLIAWRVFLFVVLNCVIFLTLKRSLLRWWNVD